MKHIAVLNKNTNEILYTQMISNEVDINSIFPKDSVCKILPKDVQKIPNFTQRLVWNNESWVQRSEPPSYPCEWNKDLWEWVWRKKAHKLTAKQRVDAEAENKRWQVLTPGSGQAMEYQAAYQEALAFLRGDNGHFPMLQADVDAGYSDDFEEAATTIVNMHDYWEIVGAQIRKTRLEAKRKIDEAQTPEEVDLAAKEAFEALSSFV